MKQATGFIGTLVAAVVGISIAAFPITLPVLYALTIAIIG